MRKYKSVLKYALLCVLMCCAGFFAALYFYGPADTVYTVSQPPVQSEKYTAEQYRTERQQLRSMQKAQINEIIYNSQSDSETAAMAQKQLLEILSREEKENLLEGMLEIRGFDGAVVSVRPDSATVMISSEMITRQESSVILDIVCRETGLLGGDIKIIPIK